MGVYASFCELCQLPLQLDHYVTPNGEPLDGFVGMVSIWRRGSDSSAGFTISPKHAWLEQAVSFIESPPVHGLVGDGRLEAADGETHDADDAPLLHRACWELVGSPEHWAPKGALPDDGPVVPFQRQLFDFAGLLAAGHHALLEDPRENATQRARLAPRIDIVLGRAPSPVVALPTLEQVIEAAGAAGADIVLVHANEAPVLRKGLTVLATLPHVWTHEHWRAEVLGGLSEVVFNELFSTGSAGPVMLRDGVKLYVKYTMEPGGCTARLLLKR